LFFRVSSFDDGDDDEDEYGNPPMISAKAETTPAAPEPSEVSAKTLFRLHFVLFNLSDFALSKANFPTVTVHCGHK
jgi:hypothetical protein